MHILPVYRSSAGLIDKLDALRPAYNPETGVLNVTQADNVIFDASGAVVRRAGQTLLIAGNFHSGFSCGAWGLCVKDGVLNVVNSDLSLTAVTPTVSIRGKKVCYAKVIDDAQETVLFTDGLICGRIRNKVSTAWTVQPYAGIQSFKAQTQVFLPTIPLGHLMCIYNGRLYMAVDEKIYVSEFQAYSWFDDKLTFSMDSRVTMLRPALAGLYVGTLKNAVFFAGASLRSFARIPILDSGVIEGSDNVYTAAVGTKNFIYFASPNRGIFVFDDGGNLLFSTEDFLDFPSAVSGASLVHNKQYTLTLAV